MRIQSPNVCLWPNRSCLRHCRITVSVLWKQRLDLGRVVDAHSSWQPHKLPSNRCAPLSAGCVALLYQPVATRWQQVVRPESTTSYCILKLCSEAWQIFMLWIDMFILLLLFFFNQLQIAVTQIYYWKKQQKTEVKFSFFNFYFIFFIFHASKYVYVK